MAGLLSSLAVDTDSRECFVGASRLDPGASLADSPLLPGAVVSVGGPGPDYQLARGDAAGTFHAIAGPDEGFGVALRPGRHTIGRAADAGVCLRDTDVSRSHALIEVGANGGARIADAGSRNGTFVNGHQITEPTVLGTGDLVRIGRDQFRWVTAGARALRVIKTDDARLEFDRVFAPVPAVAERQVDLPASEASSQSFAAMAMGAIGGLMTGLIMFATMRNPAMLLMSFSGILAPMLIRGVENSQRKKQRRNLLAARESAADLVKTSAADEEGIRHQRSPGPAEVLQMATGVRPDLWPRDARSPLGLVLRVGTADQPAAIRLNGDPWEGLEVPVLRGAPVTLDLRETGVLGVIGMGEPASALLRWLVVQLAVLRSPDDLRIVLLTSGDDGEDMSWIRWLPHLDAGTTAAMPCRIGNTKETREARIRELGQLIESRLSPDRDGAPVSFAGEVVVVLDGALALRNLTGMRDILRRGPEAGVYVLCADSRDMSECRGVCETTADGLRLIRSPNAVAVSAILDGVDRAQAEQVARAVAPMRDRLSAGDVQTAIPYPVRLLDLQGIGVPDADDILGLWGSGKPGPKTRVILGADASGPATIDFAKQGPHTMLGGATGAGKSILLQTLVTALLLANRPDEMNLVLVDFKGGSAFLPFEHCPHVTALIRSTGETAADSFDEADAARMLASVAAEVRRRESILARYGGEIDEYWQTRESRPEMPPLPRLVMIFDEFARVLDVSPNFLKELVNVAGKGRSLGMHLVLATQSLQGKLSPELKNNISLRISLRQNEPTDSTEVLGAPDAASIPGTVRGRGMILCTTDERRTPRLFQSGYLGNPPPAGTASTLTLRTMRWTDLGAARPVPKNTSGDEATDQYLAIKAIEEASALVQAPAPFLALRPALPVSVPLNGLAEYQTGAVPDTAAPFGLLDEPDLQAQPACCLDVAGTDRVLVAGGPQSGRTTFARTLITSLASRFRPDKVHLYVVEHQPAGLAEYTDLPHCGGVFSSAEPDRIRRLVGWLDAEAKRRAATRFGPGGQDNPAIVVIVDGWEQFESRADPSLAEVSLGPTLREVMAAGAPLGVHIVPIGGEELAGGKVAGLCNQRLLLSFPKEETRRTHLRGGMTSPLVLPGRAIDAGSGRHVQICLPGVSGTELTASVAASHETADLDRSRLPKRFPSLPSRITVKELTPPSPVPSGSWIPLGVGGQDVATLGTDLFGAGPHTMFIAGPPGSGRTTALATLARSLTSRGIEVIGLAPPQSPLERILKSDKARVATTATADDADLRGVFEQLGDSRVALLLDDADRITVNPSKQGFVEGPTLLEDLVRPVELGQRALIIAADPNPILSGQRRSLAKVTNEILMSGTRVLLTPAKRPDARQLNISLEPDQYFTGPPGRAYVASTGAPQLIQLAITA